MFEEAITICEILNKHGFEAYIVGGTIRDLILGNKPKDIDIATDATPEQVYASMIDRFYVAPTGEKFGTVSIIDFFSHKVLAEVTTYRSEGRYYDKRHPDSVKFEKDLKKDLSRRDFTMNAVAYDPIKDEFIDPFNGIEDIMYGIIRTVGVPKERFLEDPLRIMRMCRFATSLNFRIMSETEYAGRDLSKTVRYISKERIRDEFLKILLSNPQRGIGYLRQTKLLEIILPELDNLQGVFQPPQYHSYDVYNHCVHTAKWLSEHTRNPYLIFAGLVHDLGKTKMSSNPPPYFPHHVTETVKMLPNILNRFKFSNDQKRYITFIVEHHMDAFNYLNHMPKRAVRRYLNKIKSLDYLGDLRIQMHADMYATGKDKTETLKKIDLWFDKIFEVITEEEPFTKDHLVIDGNDLMEAGIPASPVLGKIKDTLTLEVVDNPELNTKKYLINRAKEILAKDL